MRLIRFALGLAVIGVAVTALASPGGRLIQESKAQALTVSEVLQRARGACGWDKFSPGISGYTITGKAQESGLDSKWTFMFDSYRFLEQTDGTGAGRTWTSISAFDGKQSWKRDWGGLVSVRDLADLEEANVLFDIRTYRWLNKEMPLDFTIDTAATNDDVVVMSWTKRMGSTKGKVTIDRKSWLATQFDRETSAGIESWKFEDYKEVSLVLDGTQRKFEYPFKMTRTSAGLTDTFEVQSFLPRSATPADPFGYVLQPVEIEKTGAKPQIESKWVKAGLVLVHPMINSKDLGWFILDSGAGSIVIDQKTAKEAGMPSFGQVAAVGIGGSEKATWVRANSIELGGVRIKDLAMAAIDLSAISTVLGVKCVGICGWDVFARSVVELNVAEQKVAVYPPDDFAEDIPRWFPLQFSNNHPVVRCRFEGRTGLFRLDTGATNTVTFHSPAVKAYKLLDGRTTKKTMLGGVGGMSPAEVGELLSFELGPKHFEKPSATFAIGDRGPLADPFLIGNVGQGFLKTFRVVLDYPNARIAFVEK